MRLTFMALAASLAAPAVASAVDMPVKLKDGATWTQTTVHSRTDVRDSQPAASQTATSVLKLVYNEQSGARTLREEFVSFQVEGVQRETANQLTAQAKLIYPAVLDVDESLLPQKVRDWPKMREVIFAALAASTSDQGAFEAVKANFARMSDVQAASLFKEQALVGIGQGVSLELGERRTYEDQVPNLFGGPAIKTNGEIRLDGYDAKAGRAIVAWSQSLDPASLATSVNTAVNALVARMQPEKQAKARAQLASLTMDRKDSCRFEIDLTTGLATKADCTSAVTSGAGGRVNSRTDHWVITQSTPESR
jgi:hypothetical protein